MMSSSSEPTVTLGDSNDLIKTVGVVNYIYFTTCFVRKHFHFGKYTLGFVTEIGRNIGKVFYRSLDLCTECCLDLSF